MLATTRSLHEAYRHLVCKNLAELNPRLQAPVGILVSPAVYANLQLYGYLHCNQPKLLTEGYNCVRLCLTTYTECYKSD